MKELTGRLLDIAMGEVDLPADVVHRYRDKLSQAGYDLSCAPLPKSFPSPSDTFGDTGASRATVMPPRRSAMPSRVPPRPNFASAFTPGCRWLREILTYEPCRCGSSRMIPVHGCANKYKRCIVSERDRRLFKDPDWKIQCCEACPLRDATPQFITTARLAEDVKGLVAILPPGITQVAGIARSGLHAASLISMLLHVPLLIVRQTQGDIVEAGHGWRLAEGRPAAEETTLIVDDTVMTGNSLQAVTPLVEKRFPKRLFAAVYVNPLARKKPDLWAVDLPWPHLLEWNLFNSVLSPMTAVDFDGILCQDCPMGDDDDGPRYAQFLESAVPLYLSRKTTIPLIVTARLEKYRSQTLAWLQKWGLRVERLEMGPWRNNGERAQADIVGYKAQHFRQFMQTHRRRGPQPHLFVESNPRLAKSIAERSGGVVVCPAAGRCFP